MHIVLKFLHNLGTGSSLPKTTLRAKINRVWARVKIWDPYLFLQPLKLATSNLVYNRDVTSTKTLKYKYKYKYKYPSFKYKCKHEYLVFVASTDKVHERRCKQKLWNRQSSSAYFFLFSLITQAQLYDDIVCGAY